MPHPFGQRFDLDVLRVVHFLRRGLLDMLGRQLHLDDVGAKLGGDLSGIGHHVNRRFPVLADLFAARIGPDDHGQPMVLGVSRNLPQLLVHHLVMRGAGIDRISHGHASKLKRVLDACGDRRCRVLLLVQGVVVVQLEDQRDHAGKLGRAGLQEAERRRIRIAAGLDGQLEMIEGIIARRIDRKASRRPMLDPLVHGQNQAFAGPLQRAVI